MTPDPARVLWVGPSTPLTLELRRLGVEVEAVGAATAPGRGSVWSGRRLLRSEGRRIVHLEGSGAIAQWAVAARLSRLPVVWHVSDDLVPALPAGVRPNLLVADSAAALAAASAGGRGRVVPVAVEPPAAASFPSTGPVRLLGAVCPMRVDRGQHAFLKAFALAFAPPSPARAVVSLVPDGSDPQDGRRLRSLAAALGLSARIEVVDALGPRLARLDAFVHVPPLPPASPRSVVEAMAAGVPVVAARHGADAETVEHDISGLLASPDEASDLTLQLMRLDLDRALRLRLAAAGLRRAQDFSPARSAQAWLDVYRELRPGASGRYPRGRAAPSGGQTLSESGSRTPARRSRR